MNPLSRLAEIHALSRRTFLGSAGLGLGALALAELSGSLAQAADDATPEKSASLRVDNPLAPRKPPRPAKARSVIYLHMSGAPPVLDLFDYKPKLVEMNLQPCPESLYQGERFAFIKGPPKLLGTPHEF